MSPHATLTNTGDGRFMDAIQDRHLCFGVRCVGVYLFGLLFRQLRSSVSFTTSYTKHLNGVQSVLTRSDVLKVFNSVVQFVSVFVVDLMTIWARSNKGGGDNSVSQDFDLPISYGQHVDRVAVRSDFKLPNGLREISCASPDSTEARYFVVLESFHGDSSPLFVGIWDRCADLWDMRPRFSGSDRPNSVWPNSEGASERQLRLLTGSNRQYVRHGQFCFGIQLSRSRFHETQCNGSIDAFQAGKAVA